MPHTAWEDALAMVGSVFTSHSTWRNMNYLLVILKAHMAQSLMQHASTKDPFQLPASQKISSSQ
jgi:hypothetical protein